jgi:hypothetical protein
MVHSDFIASVFTNAAAEVSQTRPEPAKPLPPKWISRPGAPIAPATGYFATAKVGDRWWLVDPEGKPFFDVGTDHIRYEGHTCEALGYAPYSRVSAAKYGSEAAWAKTATQRLKDWNFNTVAAGHAPSTEHRGLVHINFAAFGQGFARRDWICEPIHWTGFPNVFSPDWPRYCRAIARTMAAQSDEDPWCMGTFLDNELEWYGKGGSLVTEIFQRGPDHTAKKALLDWLIERYGDLAGVNAALGTTFADRAAFLASTTVPKGPKMPEVLSGFLKIIADKYFSVSCGAMHAADPHHLVMGCRFAGQAPEEVLPFAGHYTDVFTINTYPWVDMNAGVVLETPAMLMKYYELAQKPMIITEWSFPALDSGLPCKAGAGMRVDTQAQKADCYRIFADMIADLPFMVGYHYFMYLDEPAQGIAKTFPEDSNYGLINVNDEVYTTLVNMATKVNGAVAQRHAKSVMPTTTAESEALPAAGVRAVLRNTGTRPITDVPAVLDRDVPVAAILRSLAPGATWDPPAAADNGSQVDEVTLSGGGTNWSAAKGGGLFAVSAEGLSLGKITVGGHEMVDGKNSWETADEIESLRVRKQGNATLLDAVLVRKPAEGENGPPAFRVGVRAVVFADRPLCLVRPLWYESLDERPWRLEQAFVFVRPAIGGNADTNTGGGPNVPMYYLRFGAWTDKQLGGLFGAFSPRNDWSVSFWEDESGKHPDSYFKVGVDFTKGQRWTAPQMGYLWLFGLKDAGGRTAIIHRAGGAGPLAISAP